MKNDKYDENYFDFAPFEIFESIQRRFDKINVEVYAVFNAGNENGIPFFVADVQLFNQNFWVDFCVLDDGTVHIFKLTSMDNI